VAAAPVLNALGAVFPLPFPVLPPTLGLLATDESMAFMQVSCAWVWVMSLLLPPGKKTVRIGTMLKSFSCPLTTPLSA